MQCKFCSNDEESECPPVFIVYNNKEKRVEYVLCAQCMSNIDVVMREFRYTSAIKFNDDEIPY